jgi:antitoxin component YwqK of YwqJK toxin-antitoxin module
MKKIKILITIIVISVTGYSCQSQVENGKEQLKYSNGQVQFEHTKKNGVSHGPYKAYYEDGSIRAEGNYVDGDLDGMFKSYTPSGELAEECMYKKGWEFEKKIYWQIVNEPNEYLFVSKEGFFTLKNGKFIKLDTTTPDNIISTKFDLDSGQEKRFIWKGGQKEPL